MWQSSTRAVRQTVEILLPARGRTCDVPSPTDIVGRVENAICMINAVTESEFPCVPADFGMLQDEVAPELWIDGLLLADAYGHDPAAVYAAASRLSLDVVAAVKSEAELVQLQRASDRDVLPEALRVDDELDPLRLLAYEHCRLCADVLAIKRIADEASHGVVVSDGGLVREAAGGLLLAAVRIADASDANLGCAVAVRLGMLRDKCGTTNEPALELGSRPNGGPGQRGR
jgi:hypothetical protein